MIRNFLCAAAIVSLVACQPAVEIEPPADLVLTNGKIVTLDETVSGATALAARDGRLVAVGSGEEIATYVGEATEVIDLAGKLVVPGFIEGHGHFLGLGDSRIQLDLRSAATWDEIVSLVDEAAAELEPGEWIRGRGWHQEKWSEAPSPAIEGLPLHASLSAVSPENPVLLTHASGHAVFANAKALELAGIDDSTADPGGGEILRGADGRATGFLRETAQRLVHAARAEVPSGELGRMVDLASEECLAKGVTSFQDAGTPFAELEALRQAVREGRLGVRLWMMIRDSNEALTEHLAAALEGGDEFLQVGGIKVSIDGALGARGAWLLDPYSDSPESTGLNLIPLDEVRETAEIAISNGVQLCIHAIGDRANREILDLYEETFAAHPDRSDLRWRIEHAQHLNPDDIPRFSELGVVASMQGVHCTSDGPWVPDRLGEGRSEAGAYVWRKLADSGALIINGTDVPVEDVDPIANFYSSVTRMMNTGEAFYPSQKMAREEALRTMTINAARAVFQENDKGSISVGKLADLTVLSKDILTIADDEIPSTRVEMTVVGGKIAYRAN